MAGATLENIEGVRSAIAAKPRRSRLRGLKGGTGEPCARRRRGARMQHGAFARGLGASVLIASGYVAAVAALRVLLTPG